MSKKNKKLNILSVFSGVGGIELGLDHKKFNVVGFAENDKHCSAVLKYHWEDIPNYGDVREINAGTIPDSGVQILVGGTPCQNLSISQGDNRKGLDGSKSRLFFEYIRLVNELKPDYFIWENVKGTYNSRNGWDFARVQMEALDTGYDIYWDLLTGYEHGIPQARERVFIVGFHPDSRGGKVFRKTRIDNEDAKSRSSDMEDSEEDCRTTFLEDTDDLVVAYSKSTRKKHLDHRIRINDTANTLTTGKGCVAQSSGTYVAVGGDPENIRIFTPLECERLMGWPDNHTKLGNYNGEVMKISDNQRYKMCGNGIVSSCAKAVTEKLYSWHFS